jgi:signal transduction histidine kinase
MRERIRQVGGTFSFESTATGTRICAIMSIHPWPQARSA